MKTFRLKILDLLRSKKINIFLLFFVLSFSILILTKLSKIYTATIPFKLNPKQVDDAHVLVNANDKVLDVTIQTSGFNWFRYAINQPSLDINFSKDVSRKDSTIIWSVSKGFSNINKQFSKEQKVISINPDTLVFKFDVNAVKYVPVKLDVVIKFAQDYNTLDVVKTKPDSIKLIGPSSVLKNIADIKTKKAEFLNIKKNINKALPLQLAGLNKEVKTNVREVDLHVTVSKFSEAIVTLPIEVINLPEGQSINYFPKEVSLSYITSLDNYNLITNQDFKVICDYNNATENFYLIPELVKQPKIVKNTRFLQQKIEYIIIK